MHTVQIVEATNAGVGRHVLDLCEQFVELGDEVTLVYSTRRLEGNIQRRISDIANRKGVSCIVSDMRRGPHVNDYKIIRTLRNQFRNHAQVDLVHGHSTKGGAIARMVGKGLHRPVIYTPNAIRSMDPQLSRMSRKLITSVEKWLSRYTSYTIAVSPEEEQHLLVDVRVPRSQVSVVPNGIRPIELPSRAEARATLRLDPDELILGFVGRLGWQKGPDLLIEAMPKIISLLPNIRLAMIGQGDMMPSLRARAEQLKIDKSINWLGYQDGPSAMPAFDALILPSRYEGLPYVLIEALSAGIAIVASDQTGYSLLVENGVNGFVYPFRNTDALADAVSRVFQNSDNTRKMGEQSRKKSHLFTAEEMAKQTRDIYASVLGKSSKRK